MADSLAAWTMRVFQVGGLTIAQAIATQQTLDSLGTAFYWSYCCPVLTVVPPHPWWLKYRR